MSGEADLERRLTEIRDDVRDLKRLLIGSDGEDGALNRVTKLESRQGFITTCYLWLLFIVFGLGFMVVPGYFNNQQVHK